MAVVGQRRSMPSCIAITCSKAAAGSNEAKRSTTSKIPNRKLEDGRLWFNFLDWPLKGLANGQKRTSWWCERVALMPQIDPHHLDLYIMVPSFMSNLRSGACKPFASFP